MKLKKWIDKILETIIVGQMVFLVLIIMWQVISRYVLSSPSSFTEELSRFCLIWMGMFCSAYGVGQNYHLFIDFIEKFVNTPERKKAFRIIPKSIVGIFSFLVLVVGGFYLVFISYDLKQTSAALTFPIWFIYLSIPTAGLLMTYYAIFNIVYYKEMER